MKSNFPRLNFINIFQEKFITCVDEEKKGNREIFVDDFSQPRYLTKPCDKISNESLSDQKISRPPKRSHVS